MTTAQTTIRRLVVVTLGLFGLTLAAFALSTHLWGGAAIGALLFIGSLAIAGRRRAKRPEEIRELV